VITGLTKQKEGFLIVTSG